MAVFLYASCSRWQGFRTVILQLAEITFRTVSLLVGVAFAAGYVAGFWTRSRHVQSNKDDWALFAAGVIMVIWAASMGFAFWTDHSTSWEVHALMGAAVGYLFGSDNPIRVVAMALRGIEPDTASDRDQNQPNQYGTGDPEEQNGRADDTTGDDGDSHR